MIRPSVSDNESANRRDWFLREHGRLPTYDEVVSLRDVAHHNESENR